jgi:hypothetical protein
MHLADERFGKLLKHLANIDSLMFDDAHRRHLPDTALEHALIAHFGTLRRVPAPFLLGCGNGLVCTSRMDQLLGEAEALLMDPQALYNPCLIGTAERGEGMLVAAYDTARVIEAMASDNGWDMDEAREFFEFNVLGTYAGDKSPVFVDLMAREV